MTLTHISIVLTQYLTLFDLIYQYNVVSKHAPRHVSLYRSSQHTFLSSHSLTYDIHFLVVKAILDISLLVNGLQNFFSSSMNQLAKLYLNIFSPITFFSFIFFIVPSTFDFLILRMSFVFSSKETIITSLKYSFRSLM